MKKLEKWHYWLLLSPLIGLIVLALGFVFKGYYEDIFGLYLFLVPFLLPSLILFIILISVKKHFTDYFIIGGIAPTLLVTIWLVFMTLFYPPDALWGIVFLLIPIIGIPAMPFGILFSYGLHRLKKKRLEENKK